MRTHGKRWAVGYFLPVELLENVLPFNAPPRVYLLYFRVYQDLLKIPYLVGSRDPTQYFLNPHLLVELFNVKVSRRRPSAVILHMRRVANIPSVSETRGRISLFLAATSLAVNSSHASMELPVAHHRERVGMD